MTLCLILTRHAKSSWDDPLIKDHARPLNKRGRKAASAMGAWLAENGHVPDQAFVSSSKRTRETWKRIAKNFDETPKVSVSKMLYHAEPDQMLNILRSATRPVVMMVAHNPGCAFFAQNLAFKPPHDSRFDRFPTAATAVFDFDIKDWSKLKWRTGNVVDFVAAKDLVKR